MLAESFERIHRSNLVGMGIVPLQYLHGESAQSHGLTGHESFDIHLPEAMKPHEHVQISVNQGEKVLTVICRYDTEVELEYGRNGGILQYMVRKLAGLKK